MNHKLTVLVVLLVFNSKTFAATYNPEKVPKKQLAKVSNVGRSWLDPKRYKIVSVNDSSSRYAVYNKFAPGIYILEWRFTDLEDYGFGSSEVEIDRGKLIANFAPGKKYIIGANPEIVGGAAIYQKSESSDKSVVSVACENEDCSKLMDRIAAGTETVESLKKKAYAQSLLDSLKGLEAPKFDKIEYLPTEP